MIFYIKFHSWTQRSANPLLTSLSYEDTMCKVSSKNSIGKRRVSKKKFATEFSTKLPAYFSSWFQYITTLSSLYYFIHGHDNAIFFKHFRLGCEHIIFYEFIMQVCIKLRHYLRDILIYQLDLLILRYSVSQSNQFSHKILQKELFSFVSSPHPNIWNHILILECLLIQIMNNSLICVAS